MCTPQKNFREARISSELIDKKLFWEKKKVLSSTFLLRTIHITE